MKKWTISVILLLSLAVIALAAAVVVLAQRPSPEGLSGAAGSQPAQQAAAEAGDEAGSSSLPEEGGGESAVTGLRCSVSLGTLEIVSGDEFGVSGQSGSGYEAYVEDGVYVVQGSTTHDNHIVVTVPQDVSFQSVELTVSGGALHAEDLHTQTLRTVCEKGALHFSGWVDGSGHIEQFQGNTVVTLYGSQRDFNYELDYDLGHIGIGGVQYAGADEVQSIDNGAEKTLDIRCGMGNVSVLFQDEP